MPQAYIRFYAELNYFLPPGKKHVSFIQVFNERISIKNLIEALGVPHTEIDLILANGISVDFSYQVQDGDHLSVYPIFETLNIEPLVKLRPKPLRNPGFILDCHLGKLAVYLRMLGFDTLYQNNYQDEKLVHISLAEHRILLTKDRGLLKRKIITHGYCVQQVNPKAQIIEVIRRFDLSSLIEPFKRCLRCNGIIEPVPKKSVAHRLPANTLRYYDEFFNCQSCGLIYWKGSHYLRMQVFIHSILAKRDELLA